MPLYKDDMNPTVFRDPETGRSYQLNDVGSLLTRVPVFRVKPAALDNQAGRPFHIECKDFNSTLVRAPSYHSIIINRLLCPPWAGWKPSWETRMDPGHFTLKIGKRIAYEAPLLAMADDFVGEDYVRCANCAKVTPRMGPSPSSTGQLDECFYCHAPLPAPGRKPYKTPAVMEPQMFSDKRDVWLEFSPTAECRPDFHFEIEIRGMVSKPISA